MRKSVTFALPILICSIAFMLSGCVSTHMKAFIGKDIREVMLTEGPPINAFDLSEGRRAFQYRFGGGTFVTPQVSNTATSATVVGNSVWLDQRTITQPAAIVESQGCVISYIAEFDQKKSSWTVVDIRYPKRLVC
jgi:hypothetical protein